MKKKYLYGVLMAFMLAFISNENVYASDDGQEYITISVEAEDESGHLLYALDTDEPGAFSSSNKFSVPAGTSHTIYVKDAAGNISSQEFTPTVSTDTAPDMSVSDAGEKDSRERRVNIDVTLGNETTKSDYNTVPVSPAEEGQGTVYDQLTTSASDNDAQKLFYTVTTKDGEVFYLIIDQSSNSDNVYLLDQVKVSDLHAMAIQDTGEINTKGSNSLLSALNSGNDDTLLENIEETNGNTDKSSKKSNTTASGIVVLLIVALVGGGYYYLKIYRNKRDEQMDLVDAPDKDDFEIEDDDDGETVDFGLDDDYQEQVMSELLSDDEIEKDQEESKEELPEKYATSHMKREQSDIDIFASDEEPDEYDEDLDAPEEEE